jgi:uncharacterized membrane protein
MQDLVPPDHSTWLRRNAPGWLAALFIGSGTLHLLRPALFAGLVPAVLPAPRAIITLSGIAELLCATGLLARRRWAGILSALLLVAIFPGNVTMALSTAADPGSSRLARLATWARLPLQVPLIWAALQSGRTGIAASDPDPTRRRP